MTDENYELWYEKHIARHEDDYEDDEYLLDYDESVAEFEDIDDELQYYKDLAKAQEKQLIKMKRTISDLKNYSLNKTMKVDQPLSEEEINTLKDLGINDMEMSYFRPRENFKCEFPISIKSNWSIWDRTWNVWER